MLSFVPRRRMSRRALMGALGTGTALAVLPNGLRAEPADVARAIAAVIGNRRPQSERVSLTLPADVADGASVPLQIDVLSAMTAAERVKAVHVFADGNPEPQVISAYFTLLSGKASLSTRVRLARSQRLTAIAVMQDETVFAATAEVRVGTSGFAASANAGGDVGARIDLSPRIEVAQSVPPARPFEVKTQVSHPMEVGRVDRAGAPLPRRIINQFVCALDERDVLRCDFYPAIAADPYLAFYASAERSTRLECTWRDDDGSLYGKVFELIVS